MDALIIRMATGLGLQSAIGWFPPALFGVMNVLPILLGLFFYADKSTEINKVAARRKAEESRNRLSSETTQYDFIVVGAGSAGCVVANRLSQYFNVLLLERGGEPHPLTVVPGMQPALLGNTEVDYKYLTISQNRSCLACINGETFWNAGFGLGGGSMINGMIFVRGHPFDYNRWSEVTKDDRWKYENVLPYFLRSEGLCTDCEYSSGVMPTINPKYHNYDGELPIRPPPISPLVPEFLEAMEWAGIKKGDMNAPFYTEIADTHTYNHVNGRRVSTYNAFVEPVIGNSLKVVKYARVIEILFEEGTKRAIGVKYERFGEIVEVQADKEVIISAGAIETPKLLMLSGIGPREDLEKLEIPVRCNLPVGRNLQNHVTSFVGPFLIDEPLSLLPERVFNESAVDAYLKNGTGPYSIMFAHSHTHWISSHARRSGESRWPDIQVHMQANGVGQQIDVQLSAQHNFKPALLRQFLEPVKGNDAFLMGPSYSRPKSRGSIRLRSKNYLDHPLIDPNLFSDPENIDAQVTVEGIQRAVFIAENAPSYKKLGARLSPIQFPSCKHHPHKSKKYWECLILHIPLEVHHFAGTTPMGTPDSRKAVVDSELRVIGTSALRVIDAGIMPYVTSSNTWAPTMMIAERGSDFIIDSYYSKK